MPDSQEKYREPQGIRDPISNSTSEDPQMVVVARDPRPRPITLRGLAWAIAIDITLLIVLWAVAAWVILTVVNSLGDEYGVGITYNEAFQSAVLVTVVGGLFRLLGGRR